MRLATLKKDLYFGRGGVLPKGTVVQVVEDDLTPHQLYGYRLLAPGGIGAFVYKYELDNVVEFLADDDETRET